MANWIVDFIKCVLATKDTYIKKTLVAIYLKCFVLDERNN